MAEAWSKHEVDRAIDVYFSMLRLELDGRPFNKAEFRRRLLHDVERSPGSVEYKLQNVSAVLAELGAVFIDGYKPARNVQGLLRQRVFERFADASDIRQQMLHAVEAPPTRAAGSAVLEDPAPIPEVAPRGAVGHHARRGRFTDFQQREADNRALGLAGELAVMDLERRRLSARGRPDLSRRVRHVSVEDGDGLGHDVLSYDLDGSERFLEVKTTRYSPQQPFLVSQNEVDFSVETGDRFTLIRLFRFERDAVGYYELRGSLHKTALLRPTTYQGVPAGGAS